MKNEFYDDLAVIERRLRDAPPPPPKVKLPPAIPADQLPRWSLKPVTPGKRKDLPTYDGGDDGEAA